MIVCIAEKPSVASDIAKVLGAKKRHDGYFEGNGYQVTWTFGHLCTLKEPDDYKKEWKRWSLQTLPMFPDTFGIKLINIPMFKKQYKIIEKLFRGAEKIINCGDAGQEGELIQRWVMQQAKVRCPVERLWISSLTEEAIREGFRSLKPQAAYDNLYLAGLSRACGDWLIGMNATRLYTLRYSSGKGVLSVGRVQTPTLSLIINRQKEIDTFMPTPYWQFITTYRGTKFTSVDGDIKSGEKRQAIERQIETLKHLPFVVKDIQEKPSTQAAPQLYDLTSLQVDCNRRYGMTAEQTLNALQGLYERKLTTYPRVDTHYLSDDIYAKCPGIIAALAMDSRYASLTGSLVGVTLKKSKRVFDTSKVTDHHAIIPTTVTVDMIDDNKHLSGTQEKVYDLIVKRFLAVFYPDSKVNTTTVTGSVREMTFAAKGKTILDAGWRAVYGKDLDEETQEEGKKEDEALLPSFTIGERGAHKPELIKKMTTPPKAYTEATLLRAMETAGKFVDDDTLRAALKENGIGRPSSRANIIETLFKRGYLRREKKNIIPTQTGINLIEHIREPLLKSCEMTGMWEKKLREIERGEYAPDTFMKELKEQIKEIVNDELSKK